MTVWIAALRQNARERVAVKFHFKARAGREILGSALNKLK
jgi:hypothetical protein